MSLFDSISARGASSFGALGVSGRTSVGANGVTDNVSANISGLGRIGVDSRGNVNIGGISAGFGQGGGGGGTSDCVSQVWGGISLSEAKALHQKSLETRLAFKNLWMLEVVSSPLGGDFTEAFNLFAHSVEFTPITLAGDKVNIGAAVMDTITSAQPIELSVTTRDDQYGTLRRWFDAHAAEVAHSDGTIGYPADYGISIKITHAFVTPDSNKGGFEDKGRYRPGTINVSLSREEQNAEMLTMTFIQLDTFMAWK